MLIMPKLNEWAETSPNPSAKLDQTIVFITSVIVPCNLVLYLGLLNLGRVDRFKSSKVVATY